GINGKKTTNFYGLSDEAHAITIQQDGKIVAVGTVDYQNHNYFGLIRYNSDGTLDNSFDSDGKVISLLNGNTNGIANAVAMQTDGKIIAGGQASNDFAMIRYNTDGSLDNSFGSNGSVITDFGVQWSACRSVAIQSDGKIILAGDKTAYYTLEDFALARYISEFAVGLIDFSDTDNSVFIYPNPINQTATLKYELRNQETICIRLMDIHGSVLATFVENEKQDQGEHEQEIYVCDEIPPGSYYLVISTADGGRMSVKIVK
ncbi:MAG TPA: T9SS type A sorting domain-containing protein, partial [Chitinophagales bacterium]|nr:T9SS type A sorting domain-containing protein [Chitinophagales bacterium]